LRFSARTCDVGADEPSYCGGIVQEGSCGDGHQSVSQRALRAGIRRILQNPVLQGKKIADLLGNPEKLKEMDKKARDFVLRYYSWDTITDQLIEAYIKAIERNSPNR
jgi:glycosyltransferase involved in cell wall biosynthesis